MPSIFRALAFAAIGMGSVACVSVRAVAAESGVSGAVTVSPALPGPQREGESGGKPLAGVEVQLRNAGGAIVARANADANGKFRILVPAGQYELRIDTRRTSHQRCQSQSVQVADGQMVNVDIACDSGIR